MDKLWYLITFRWSLFTSICSLFHCSIWSINTEITFLECWSYYSLIIWVRLLFSLSFGNSSCLAFLWSIIARTQLSQYDLLINLILHFICHSNYMYLLIYYSYHLYIKHHQATIEVPFILEWIIWVCNIYIYKPQDGIF